MTLLMKIRCTDKTELYQAFPRIPAGWKICDHFKVQTQYLTNDFKHLYYIKPSFIFACSVDCVPDRRLLPNIPVDGIIMHVAYPNNLQEQRNYSRA
jgi:hypothetical protein